MAQTTFSGPVASTNGFINGTSSSPVSVTTAQNINSAYGTTSATTGDTRLVYDKLTFTSTGSGETLRAFSVVTGAGAAAGGTINGAHISMSVSTGGTISGAANALRATLGVASGVTPGGTLAALQVDSDIASGVTVPGSAAFIRVTNSNSTALSNLFNLPDAMVQAIGATSTTPTQKIRFVDSAGTAYFLYAVEA
ncbi:MAG: hypothetical protein ACO29M_07010 [Fluviibacter sp.]